MYRTHTEFFRYYLGSHIVEFVIADYKIVSRYYFKTKILFIEFITTITSVGSVEISEKCVLHVKSEKFHINLSFDLAQHCKRGKKKATEFPMQRQKAKNAKKRQEGPRTTK